MTEACRMTKEEAVELMKSRLANENLRKHVLAVEAVMRGLARRLGEDEDLWGLAGILHDIDYEETKGDPQRHSAVGAQLLREMGLEEEVVQAVRAHNPRHGDPRETPMAKALYSADPLTGLIVAAALVHPDKKLSAIDPQFVMKRFGEKAFARGANREAIRSCSELGLGLEEFIEIGLSSMRGISGVLGL